MSEEKKQIIELTCKICGIPYSEHGLNLATNLEDCHLVSEIERNFYQSANMARALNNKAKDKDKK